MVDKEHRSQKGLEISTLVNTDQLKRNRYYLSSIIDMIEFLCANQLPLRGDQDAFSSLLDGGSGLFLSLFQYTLRKDTELRNVVKTIPRNATYTSHKIQNQVIEVMSTLVTEETIREVGDAFYMVKVDGTRDATGTENVSIVIRFVDDNFEVKECLLSVTTTAHGDAATITETIITELSARCMMGQQLRRENTVAYKNFNRTDWAKTYLTHTVLS